MVVDGDLGVGSEDGMDVDDDVVPMPQGESIEELREKLHAKMARMRNRGRGGNDAGSRDELLEERRAQRAAMRERRRKETKEKELAPYRISNKKFEKKQEQHIFPKCDTKIFTPHIPI